MPPERGDIGHVVAARCLSVKHIRLTFRRSFGLRFARPCSEFCTSWVLAPIT